MSVLLEANAEEPGDLPTSEKSIVMQACAYMRGFLSNLTHEITLTSASKCEGVVQLEIARLLPHMLIPDAVP